MHSWIRFLAVAMLLTAFDVGAAYQNGNKLKTDLNGTGSDYAFALGYVVGTVEVLEDYKDVCIANGVTQGQLAEVVKKYFNENPESLHKPAYVLVFLALKKVWPCATQKPINSETQQPAGKPRPPKQSTVTSPF